MSESWYYYLHQNGLLIGKNPVVVETDPQYFDSPFVIKYWKLDLKDRSNAWILLLEALALGAKVEQAKELAEHWKLTYEDSIEMLKRVEPTELMKKGMPIMIEEIFGMSTEEYWENFKGCGKVK